MIPISISPRCVGGVRAPRRSLCEVGIPYSDPIADGPVIQASYTRALERKVKLADTFRMLSRVTPKLDMPVVTMVSYAIIHRHGLEQYVADARAAGVSGAIVPDLLVEEAGTFAKVCRDAHFNLIQLVTPTTSAIGPYESLKFQLALSIMYRSLASPASGVNYLNR